VSTASLFFIHGPNGSGKSLILKSLATLVPADYKKFDFKDRPVSEWPYQEYRSLVTYCSPLPHFPPGKVKEFMEVPFALQVKNKTKPFMSQEVDAYLRDWGLNDLDTAILSSGQKQMLGILRCVTLNSELLLLDEVFSHLDQEKTLALEKVLLQWKSTTQGSIIIVSHDMAQAERMNGNILKSDSLFS
jgi:putative ABC transport system ATP-binding protein